MWQPPQPAEAKTDLPSVLAARGRLRLAAGSPGRSVAVRVEAGDGRDVGRDVLGVLALEDVGRHARSVGRRIDDRVGDLSAHDLLDRALAEPVEPRLDEGEVEVRADLPVVPASASA